MPHPARPPRIFALLTGACLAVGLSACAVATDSAPLAAAAVPDRTTVHDVAVAVDPDEYAAMVEQYRATGEKEWLSADVTIDGRTFTDVGMRLKGNSSLRSIQADSDPSEVPWLLDLARNDATQNLDGVRRLVIRSNSTETSLNEAVALDLLAEAGLATPDAAATRFSVNGTEATLRLMVQDLDDVWAEETFEGTGVLYKAEAGGDWSYRGDDAAAYDEVFDVEAGDEDYAPLTGFLQWLEEASDEEFAAGLVERLDVEAFASYLAVEDLIGNFDDIDGPGNNSYLRWDEADQRMTVVAWDHNLAFGSSAQGGGRGFGRPDGTEDATRPARPDGAGYPADGAPALPDGAERPEDWPELPEGAEAAGGRFGGGGGPGGSNVLAERFRATPEFEALYDEAVERLSAELYDSGTAQEILDARVEVLTAQASDLVDAATVAAEADAIAAYFDGHAVETEE